MAARNPPVAEARLRDAQPEMGVMRERVAIHDLAEPVCGQRMRALVEVGLAKRLEDRGLARLQTAGSLEDDGGRAGMALGEEP